MSLSISSWRIGIVSIKENISSNEVFLVFNLIHPSFPMRIKRNSLGDRDKFSKKLSNFSISWFFSLNSKSIWTIFLELNSHKFLWILFKIWILSVLVLFGEKVTTTRFFQIYSSKGLDWMTITGKLIKSNIKINLFISETFFYYDSSRQLPSIFLLTGGHHFSHSSVFKSDSS